MKHTPTPWAVDQDDPFKVTGCDLENVARTQDGSYLSSPDDNQALKEQIDAEGRANAAFIVRACNVHDELVAAAIECLKHDLTAHEPEGKYANAAFVLRAARLRAALAKAEGK